MAEEHNQIKYGTPISTAGAVVAGGAYSDVGISRLGETLTPVLNLWSMPEFFLPRAEILFTRFVIVPAVAARFASAELVNPAGSGKLVVVRVIDIPYTSDRLEIVIDTGNAIAANPVVHKGLANDGRYASLGEVSIATLTTGDLAAGAVNPQWGVRQLTGHGFNAGPYWILSPGKKLFFITGGVNETFFLNLLWSERSAFPGELQARG